MTFRERKKNLIGKWDSILAGNNFSEIWTRKCFLFVLWIEFDDWDYLKLGSAVFYLENIWENYQVEWEFGRLLFHKFQPNGRLTPCYLDGTWLKYIIANKISITIHNDQINHFTTALWCSLLEIMGRFEYNGNFSNDLDAR